MIPRRKTMRRIIFLFSFAALLLATLIATVAIPTTAQTVPPATIPASSREILSGPINLAGDIADCGSPGDEATAALLDNLPGIIATLGDNAYPDGTAADYANCYEPSWGRHKARTRPGFGNHDNGNGKHPGDDTYNYFNIPGIQRPGFYSLTIELNGVSVDLYVLNSVPSVAGGLGVNAPQTKWLKASLENNPNPCIMAAWHDPLHSRGDLDSTKMYTATKILNDHGVDIVATGHEHFYERHAPQDENGNPDPNGPTEIIAGTGGGDHQGEKHYPPIGTSVIFNTDTFGILVVTPKKNSAGEDALAWNFIPEAGKTFTDAGEISCTGPDMAYRVMLPTIKR